MLMICHFKMKIFCKNTLSGLIPLYDSDFEDKKKLKMNEVYSVEIKRPRNYEFLKKYFALLNLAFQNQDTFTNFENFRAEVIKYSGYYTEYLTLKGEVEYRAKSISFAKMSKSEFESLYSASLTVILTYVLQHNTKEEIEQELINFM